MTDSQGGTPAAPAPPPDTLETMRAEWEARKIHQDAVGSFMPGRFVERMFDAWSWERAAKVQLRKELAAAVGELDSLLGSAHRGAPEPLAALLRTHPMFLLPEDDTASPTQRQMDEHDRVQRWQRADGLAKWLSERGVALGGIAPAPAPEPPDTRLRDLSDEIVEDYWDYIENGGPRARELVRAYRDLRWRGVRISERPAPEFPE